MGFERTRTRREEREPKAEYIEMKQSASTGASPLSKDIPVGELFYHGRYFKNGDIYVARRDDKTDEALISRHDGVTKHKLCDCGRLMRAGSAGGFGAVRDDADSDGPPIYQGEGWVLELDGAIARFRKLPED
jgi:hypothetical protein